MNDENKFIGDIIKHLDQSADTLDPETLAQIRTARLNALEQDRSGFMSWARPIGGLAAAAIVLFVAVNLLTGPDENNKLEIKPDQLALVEILSDEQQVDLFENLDFYAWFAENENPAS